MKQPQARSTTLYIGIATALRKGALAATFALSLSAAALAQAGEQRAFDIPEQPLPAALKAFAEQAGMQLLYRPETIDGAAMRSLKGQLDKHQALQRLLEGTNLEAVYSGDDAATIRPRGKASVSAEGNASGAVVATAAYAQVTEATSDGNPRNAPQPASERSGRTQELETVTVTGTRIRGGQTPSPVITIGSERIREEGFTDLGQVIRSVPQNFNGGQNPAVLPGNLASAGMANQNLTGGSTLNLRGLGPDASLTLLNGRRMTYGGSFQAVDISAIPVEAVERIEIVADGASAIYGSDAVGGVGNVILKRDFDGVALSARYGAAAQGGLDTREYTATAGTSWSSGGFVATYKDVSVDPIYARQRAYADHLVHPGMIYPGSGVRSALVSGHQSLGGAVELRLDALRTRREQQYSYFFTGLIMHVDARTTTSLISPSLAFSLPNDWTLTAAGTWGKDEHLQVQHLETLATGAVRKTSDDCWCNESSMYEISTEGPLFTMGGGDARLAVGMGRRVYDHLYFRGVAGVVDTEGEDSSRFFYGEINLPFVGPQSGIAHLQRLAATVAFRNEDYDSFGKVTTPKVGLIYGPSADFTFKASWGKSFKMPTLMERHRQRYLGLFTTDYFGGTGYPPNATAMSLSGGNPNLKPERARTWAASMAFHPQALPGLDMELTWFDIDYTDRVVEPIANWWEALSNPIYAEFIDYAPTAQEQEEVFARAGVFTNYAGAPYNPANVVAIIHSRYVNASHQRLQGIDLSGSYRFDLGAGRMTLRGSASWLDTWQQTSSAQPKHRLAGFLHNPPRLNTRVGAVWDVGSVSISTFANYAGGVTNRLDNQKGSSFTTVDATVRYHLATSGAGWPQLELALSAQNMFDRNPPLYTPNPGAEVYVPPYDSTNYSPIGRFLSASVSVRW